MMNGLKNSDNMGRTKILEIVDLHGKKDVVCNELEKYKGVCGVWALFDNKTNALLEVAQTTDVYNELVYDLFWLMKDYSKERIREKRYTARRLFSFNQKFDILSCDLNRTTAKYRFIAENYDDLCVYVFEAEKAKSHNKSERELFEMVYAVVNQALFWNAYGKQRKLARNFYLSYFCR